MTVPFTPPILQRSVEGDVDLVVHSAFFPDPAYKGTMIEVGAAKPDYLSISASFRDSGWAVLSVEPNPYFCALHRRSGHDIIECACGESDQDDVSFFIVQTNGMYHGQQVTHESFSSLGMRGKYAELMKTVPSMQKEIKVKVRRLDSILEEYAPDASEIDLLCVDVEGWEMEVLNGLSFERYSPKVLIIENLFGERSYPEFMTQKGYALWKRLEPNDIYVRQNLFDLRH